MRTMLGLLLAAWAWSTGARTPEEIHALTHGAKAKCVLRLVDERGAIVTNATVLGNFNMNDDKGYPFSGVTDTNGIFVAGGKCVGDWHYAVKRDGYYKTDGSCRYFDPVTIALSDGRWQPYGATNTVVLKRKVNPVAMCVRPNREGLTPLVPPSRNEYIGFDLEKGDWVNPHGKGIHADLNVKYEYEAGRIPVLHYRGAVFFAFTNKFDGAYVMKKDSFSVFGSGYQADTNAVYRQEIAFVYDRLSGTLKENSKFPASDYLVLRTRSKTDDKGNLLSANYAKIYGPISAGSGGIYMGFYFNPNENDPNLEADTTKNLLNPRDLGFPP